ncbi:hypothetical protein GWN26_05160 [Candidatus Saccharibacteria bacterium]|nr:hypothetical protein [Candidatus Saccharibacteria bacterium]NIW78810.1 hypothetical protein [Calditrichia bacterium]
MAKKNLRDFHKELRQKSRKKYDEFLRLSLATSFAAFFFLLQIEEAFPNAERLSPYFLRFAWLFDFVSAILGSFYMFLDMLYLFFLGDKVSTLVSLINSPEGQQEEARNKATKSTLKTITFFLTSLKTTYALHLLFLFLFLGSLALFMIKNIW